MDIFREVDLRGESFGAFSRSFRLESHLRSQHPGMNSFLTFKKVTLKGMLGSFAGGRPDFYCLTKLLNFLGSAGQDINDIRLFAYCRGRIGPVFIRNKVLNGRRLAQMFVRGSISVIHILFHARLISLGDSYKNCRRWIFCSGFLNTIRICWLYLEFNLINFFTVAAWIINHKIIWAVCLRGLPLFWLFSFFVSYQFSI